MSDEIREACQYELKKRLDDMIIPILQICLGTDSEGNFDYSTWNTDDIQSRLFREDLLHDLPKKIAEFILLRDTFTTTSILDMDAYNELYTHYDNF